MKNSNFPTISPLAFLSMLKRKDSFPKPLDSGDVYFFFLGRNAIWHGIELLKLTNKDVVLIPSYNDGSEIDPFIKKGIPVKYYKINRQMEIDIDHLKSTIDKSTKALLITHYFGFPQESLEEILKICKKHNLYLIEDCAFALYSKYNKRYLGTFGDLGIFSIRKTLPTKLGGALLINNRSLMEAWKEKRNNFIPPDSYFVAREIKYMFLEGIEMQIGGMMKGLVQRFLDLSLIISKPLFNRSEFVYDEIYFDINTSNWKISRIAEFIMKKTDHEEIVKKRRENFSFLLNSLNKRGVFSKLPDGVCPAFYPIVVDEPKRIQRSLREKGFNTLVSWSYFHSDFLKEKEKFLDATFLKTHILSLPVHQGLNKRILEKMVVELRRIL